MSERFGHLDRRRFIAGGAAAGVLLATRLRRSRGASDALRLLCWEGYDDGAATAPFRSASGLDVQADYLGANDEIFTLLRAGGLGEYDIVTPSSGLVQALVTAELIQPIDLGRLKNASGLFPRFVQPDWSIVDGKAYALPLTWRTSPMIYNPAKIKEPPAKWTDLVDPVFKGKVVMTDDVVSHFLTWNRAMGADDPANVTTFALNQTIALLIRIKRDQVAAFIGGKNDLADELAHGRSGVSTTGWEVVPTLPVAKGANLKLLHPQPGDFSICDCLCIPNDAPHLDATYAFIDQMLTPESQAALAKRLYQGTVTSAAVPLLPDAVRALYSYDDLDAVFAVSPLARFPPVDSTNTPGIATYVDWVVAWDRIRFTAQQALKTPTPVPTRRPTLVRTPSPVGTETATPPKTETAAASVTPSTSPTS